MLRLEALGNLVADAVIKILDSGDKVINFTVAVNSRYTDKQGVTQESATFIECSWFTNKTDVAKYMDKGKMVFVAGKPKTRGYIGNDRQIHTNLGLTVYDFYFAGGGSKPEDNTEGSNSEAQDTEPIDNMIQENRQQLSQREPENNAKQKGIDFKAAADSLKGNAASSKNEADKPAKGGKKTQGFKG